MAVITEGYGKGERRVLSLRYGEVVKLLRADSPNIRLAGFEGAMLEAFSLQRDKKGEGDDGTAEEEAPKSRRWVKGARVEVFCSAWQLGEVTHVNPGRGTSRPVRVRVEVKCPGRGHLKIWRDGDSCELQFVDIPDPGQGAGLVSAPRTPQPSGGDVLATSTAPAGGGPVAHLLGTPQCQRRRVLGSVLSPSLAAPQAATDEPTTGAVSAENVPRGATEAPQDYRFARFFLGVREAPSAQLPGRLSDAFSLCLKTV